MFQSDGVGAPAMKYPKELIGIRGFTATWVLVHHALGSLPQCAVKGLMDYFSGANLFMMVSGYSIYWLLDTRKASYGGFLAGRFFRIFPAYIMGLIAYSLMLDFSQRTYELVPNVSTFDELRLSYIYAAQSNPIAHFLVHLTLLQGLVPQSLLHNATWAIIPSAWSLTVEWQLYLIAPVVIVCLSTIDRLISQAVLVALVAAMLLIGPSLTPGFLGNDLAMFSIGLSSYAFAKHARSRALPMGAVRGALVAMLLLVAIWDRESLPTVALWTATFYAMLSTSRDAVATTVSRFLNSKPLEYLGQISYSLYIFHILALTICLRALEYVAAPTDLRLIGLPLGTFVLGFLFAQISYRFVERPFHRFGKTFTAPKEPSPLATPIAQRRFEEGAIPETVVIS
jgi:peptidoglycan/LPS O-acetylase OafA/YrhL